jgi:hypothetical protein
MALTASKEDKQAYTKIGGAIDNLSDSYTYVARALSAADNIRNPLSNTGRVTKYLKVTGTAQRVFSYVRKVQEVLDEKKRDGGLLKLGIKISMDIAGKLLGTSLTTHPYYAYHKAQIDALADALNASRNSRAAVDAYNQAVAAANSGEVAAEFKRIESRKVEISASHLMFRDKRFGVAVDIARGMMSDALARKRIAEYGGSDKLFEPLADLETWRSNWAGLSFDIMQLQIMAGNELNIAIEAINKVKDLIATLAGGSNTSRVGGVCGDQQHRVGEVLSNRGREKARPVDGRPGQIRPGHVRQSCGMGRGVWRDVRFCQELGSHFLLQ